jgi:SMI1 / KNR4 family (SUKH-1)
MVTIGNANPHGPLVEEMLHIFENKIGVQLPQDYRDFLSNYNGGVPDPSGFWITQGDDGSCVNQFYGLHNGPRWFSIDGCTNVEWGIPDMLLSIGDDGTGNLICLGIKGEQEGFIYFVDHEIHPYNNRESFDGISKLASSFSEFLSSLQVLPE